MRNEITMGGNPVKLLGEEIKVGAVAPAFKAVKPDMSAFDFSELEGKMKIISVVPSVDTRICEFQTIRFNEEATQNPNVVVLTISVDLPFAQKRFCGAEGLENVVNLSDFKNGDFGKNYRFVFVVTYLSEFQFF